MLTGAAAAITLPDGFSERVLTTAIANPTAMAIAPDGRIFVCEQGGKLRIIENDVLLATPCLTVSTDSQGERGLLGVAFHPSFPDGRHDPERQSVLRRGDRREPRDLGARPA